MKTLINIHRNKIKAKSRQASQYWRGVYLTGHFVAGKAVASRAWLVLDERAQLDGVTTKAVMELLNLCEA